MLATHSDNNRKKADKDKKKKKYSLCFVDDDDNELRRFKETFEDEYYVGIGTDLNKAEANLKAL